MSFSGTVATTAYFHKSNQLCSRTVSLTDVYFPVFSVLYFYSLCCVCFFYYELTVSVVYLSITVVMYAFDMH